MNPKTFWKSNRNKLFVYLVLFLFFLTGCGKVLESQIERSSLATTSATVLSTVPPLATHTPTQTPTAPRKVIATQAATSTRKPTSTETPSTLLITPDVNRNFRLKEWSPELANQLINDLQFFPETLSYQEQGYLRSRYYGSFFYASLAQEEALLRYPNSEQASQWQKDRAYNLALSGDAHVGEAYAGLLVDWLSSGKISFDNLQEAFEREEPRLKLKFIPINPIEGHTHNALILIGARVWSDDVDTGVALWLFEENGIYSAYPLQGGGDFEFPYGIGIRVKALDLTGDGIPEAVVDQSDQTGGMMYNDYLSFYDLTQMPPQRIKLIPEVDPAEIINWSAYPETTEGVDISITSSQLYQRDCVGRFPGFAWNYRWDGREFILDSMNFLGRSDLEGEYWMCYGDWVRGLFHLVVGGNEAAMQLIPELIGLDPIRTHMDVFKDFPNPEDYDEIRFQQGLLLFLVGNIDASKQKMQEIVVQPMISTSPWIEPARLFIKSLITSNDFLSACIVSGKCNQILGIEEIVRNIPARKYSEAVSILKSAGFLIWNQGTYDFNQDGQDEIWFFYSDSEENIENKEFCLLYLDVETLIAKIEYISTGEPVTPFNIIPGPYWKDKQIYYLTAGNTSFILESQFSSEIPSTKFKLFRDTSWSGKNLNDIKADLFSVPNSAEVALRLEEFKKFIIDSQPIQSEYTLAYYYYLQGLAYEMAGEAQKAATLYLHLWETYPSSPYSIFARSKLEAVP